MDTSRVDSATTSLITLVGEVGAQDVGRLRAELVAALDDGERDVFLDAHAVSAFADDASTALVGGRLRAKARRRQLVVLDKEDGALATSLKRTGLVFRFPVYADAAAADHGVGTARAALLRLMVGRNARSASQA